MLSRRSWLRTVAVCAPSVALVSPVVARAAKECDDDGKCIVGIPTTVFNEVSAKQRGAKWCWAACAQMILNYYQIPIDQEDIVVRIKGGNRDEAATAREIIESLEGWMENDSGGDSYIECEMIDSVSAGLIIEYLAMDRPFLLAYNTGESGHAVVLTAAEYKLRRGRSSSTPKLLSMVVRDPDPERPSRQVWEAEDLLDRTAFLVKIDVTHVS